jgi:uncharacterized membrane protein
MQFEHAMASCLWWIVVDTKYECRNLLSSQQLSMVFGINVYAETVKVIVKLLRMKVIERA